MERELGNAETKPYLRRRAKDTLRWALATCPLPQFRDADRSIAYSKEFLQRKPESADLWSNLGIGHYRANDFANAIDSLKMPLNSVTMPTSQIVSF